jgi:hypothetical protein
MPQVKDRLMWDMVGRQLAVFGPAMLRTYTPILSATGASNPTGWNSSGSYQEDNNKFVDFEATFQATSSFTPGIGAYLLSLPVPAASGSVNPIGLGTVNNIDYNYILQIYNGDGSSVCRLFRPGTTTSEGSSGPYYNAGGAAWASGNSIHIRGRYTAAT